MPTVLPLHDQLWRIFFAARNRDNQGRIVAVDVDPTRCMRIVAEHLDPLLEPGGLGAFDHAGMGPSSAIRVHGQVWLYYFGISLRAEVRAASAIGLAISDDGLNFRRACAGPVLGAGPLDPFLTAAPCVRHTPSGFQMWYVSGTAWRAGPTAQDTEPAYGIRRTRSTDGRFWELRTACVIDPAEPLERGLARPWVAATRAGDMLWFSRRGDDFRQSGDGAYHIAVARVDGVSGLLVEPPRRIEFENPPRAGDFDSWMQAYACIVPLGQDLVMFYNGDRFGESGLGWARLAGGAAG